MLDQIQRLIDDPLLTTLDTPIPKNDGIDAARLEAIKNLVADPDHLKQIIASNIDKKLWHPGDKKRSREEMEEEPPEAYPNYQVVAVPDGYPTHPHQVQSLAELYYLTQTLPLTKLLPSSNKVLMTENFESALLEGKIAVLYSRIEELKRQGKWSLRQPQRHYDPYTYLKKNKKKEFTWDYVLREGEWMAEDFKQGSRWKRACCVEISQAVQAYWRGEEVTIKAVKPKSALKDTSVNPVLYLDPSTDLNKNDAAILGNLPSFSPFDQDTSAYQILKHMESPLIPISRLIHPVEPSQDWYNLYTQEEPESNETVPETALTAKGSPFGNLRRFTFLKPPKPPLIKNIEFRTPTIWLPDDDKLLIHYIAEFGFNWELISEHLSASSQTASLKSYSANIERRTPWQCFERYIQLNENFQFADMKGMYAYHAQQWLEQAHKQQLTTKRRISPLGVGSDSIQRGHRRLRWASMFDAMRKSMKKREDAARDRLQSHRKASEGVSQQNQKKSGSDRVPTPAELSKLKFENDKSIRKAYMDQRATRNKMAQAVKSGQPTTMPPSTAPSSAQPSGASTPRSANAPLATTPMMQQTPSRVPPGYTPEQFQQLLAQRKKNTPTPGSTPTPTAAGAGASTAATAMAGTAQRTPTKRLQFAPAQVTAIINSIQSKHPNLSKEQVTKYAAHYLAIQQQQSARAAAAAASTSSAAPSPLTGSAEPVMTPTPQQLIQQQQRQQRARQQVAAASVTPTANRQPMSAQEQQAMLQMQMQMRQHQQAMGGMPQPPYDDKLGNE